MFNPCQMGFTAALYARMHPDIPVIANYQTDVPGVSVQRTVTHGLQGLVDVKERSVRKRSRRVRKEGPANWCALPPVSVRNVLPKVRLYKATNSS